MRTLSLPSAFALAVAALAFAGPASAQSCPPGYYFASDGQCYPGGQPAAPPPVYYAPVRQPPPVYDGFALGIGLGALVGVLGNDHRGGGGGGRGHAERGHNERRR